MAFPSETAIRFVLLWVSVLGTSLYVYDWLSFSRVRPASLSQTGFELAAVGALLFLTLLLYLALPWWKLRLSHAVPFTPDDDPEIAAELARLTEEMRLRPPPHFIWDPLDPVPSGTAFGRIGRRYVRLSGGLVVRYATDRSAFRAVVLHELAHLRNRDVDQAYLSVVLWYAFVALTVTPFIPTLLDERRSAIWQLSWRLAALAALVYLTRAAVLRWREHYADLRASLCEPVGIRRLLLALSSSTTRTRTPITRFHPSTQRRLRMIDDTDGFFAVDLFGLFAAGITATLGYQNVVWLIRLYGVEALAASWLSSLIFAPLTAAVLVLTLWRSGFAMLVRRKRLTSGFAAGAAIGAGFLVGQKLSLFAVTAHSDVILGTSRSSVIWTLVAIVGLGLFGTWTAANARLWLPLSGRRSPRAALAAAVTAASLVLTVAMGAFFYVRENASAFPLSRTVAAAEYRDVARVISPGPESLYQFVRNAEVIVIVHRPLAWLGIIALWAFPVAAVILATRRPPKPLNWATLTGKAPTLSRPAAPLKRAATIGAAGAAVVVLAALVLRASLRLGIAVSTRDTDQFVLAFYVWTVALGLATQAVVAAVTAATCRSAGVILGLAAAALTSVGSALALFALPSLASCVNFVAIRPGAACGWSVSSSFARQSFEQMLVQGTLLALIGAAIGLAVAATLQRRPHTHPRAAPTH